MYLTTYIKDNIIQFKSSKNKLFDTNNIKIIEQIYVPFYKEILVNFMFKWKSFWEHKIYKSSTYDFMENNENNCYGCEPSGDKYLDKVLKWCNIQNNDKILDVGCGFGASMIKFLKYSNNVEGVEINSKIAENCKINLQNHFILDKHWYVYTDNCLDLMYTPYNYFYLFNPFNSQTMEKFIDYLTKAYLINSPINPRKIRIIYRNPICHELFINAGFNEVYEIKDFIGVKIKVYEYGE